jgi:hypothetical protein
MRTLAPNIYSRTFRLWRLSRPLNASIESSGFSLRLTDSVVISRRCAPAAGVVLDGEKHRRRSGSKGAAPDLATIRAAVARIPFGPVLARAAQLKPHDSLGFSPPLVPVRQ